MVLADGFSCRTQLTDLAGRASVHLAELLANRLAPRRGPTQVTPDPRDPARVTPARVTQPR